MAEEYRVDLSAVEQVITRLDGLVDAMDGVGSTAEYKTELPEGYLGKRFTEEADLRRAHGMMKQSISQMVAELKSMLAEARKNTAETHKSYDSQEQAVRESMR